MTFPVTADLRHVLMLKKPAHHRNPAFANRWTVPGGKVERYEADIRKSAARELVEETQLRVSPGDLIDILNFTCDCDPEEHTHRVGVFGVILPLDTLRSARGTQEEPVSVFIQLPLELVWNVLPLLELVRSRLRQLKLRS